MSDIKSLSMYGNLDADALIHLAFLDTVRSQTSGRIDLRKIGDEVFQNNSGFIYNTYERIARNPASPIKLLVTETCWKQVKNSETCREFIRKYCYVPKFTVFNADSKQRFKTKLANYYCFGYQDPKTGEFIPAPMDPDVNENGEKTVSEDAMLMAETARERAFLITLNGQHFVFDKSVSGFNRDRRAGIKAINRECGAYFTINGTQEVSSPFTMAEFGKIIKFNEPHFVLSDDSTKVLAAEQMTN